VLSAWQNPCNSAARSSRPTITSAPWARARSILTITRSGSAPPVPWTRIGTSGAWRERRRHSAEGRATPYRRGELAPGCALVRGCESGLVHLLVRAEHERTTWDAVRHRVHREPGLAGVPYRRRGAQAAPSVHRPADRRRHDVPIARKRADVTQCG